MSKSREQLIKYLSEIDITDKVVLDAGCGPKDKWASNFTKGEPKKYVTLDVDRKFEPNIIHDLNDHSSFAENEEYDIIFCLETLEHLHNPWACIQQIYWGLKYGGKVYLSSPFINPYHDEVDYARYTDEWYKKILGDEGFKDIKIKPRLATEGLPHLLQFYKLEGLRMSKIRLKKGQQNKMAEIGYFVSCTK